MIKISSLRMYAYRYQNAKPFVGIMSKYINLSETLISGFIWRMLTINIYRQTAVLR